MALRIVNNEVITSMLVLQCAHRVTLTGYG